MNLSQAHDCNSAKRRSPVVGVVKPYAVVDIDADSDRTSEDESNLDFQKRESSHSTQVDTSKGKQRLASVQRMERSDTNPGQSSAQSSPGRSFEIQKRKAPLPPPRMLSNPQIHFSIKNASTIMPEAIDTQSSKLPSPHPLLRNDTKSQASMYTFKTRDESTVTGRSRATTIASSDGSEICRESKAIRKSRPEKPPRTLSTFISADEQDDLVLLLQKCQQQPLQATSCSNADQLYLPLKATNNSASPNTTTLSNEKPMTTAYSLIVELISETLRRIYLSNMECLLCKDDLWQLRWEDVEVTSKEAIRYKGIQLHVQCVNTLEKEIEWEIKIAQFLKPHHNLHLLRGLLHSPPLSTTGLLPSSKHYLLWDDITTSFSRAILPLRKEYSPDTYAELILICLVQIFEALHHLSSNGTCHRDIGLESVHVIRIGDHWLIKLGNFKFALHRTGPVSKTTFVYGYSELEWLGGANSRLPPEVIDTPEHAQSIDYRHTDSFAAGCLIYEMIGEQNPFEKYSGLIYQEYTEADLPTVNCGSKYDKYFHHLAALLVNKDLNKRISVRKALLICQALLWLPEYMLKEPISKNQMSCYLELEQAVLLSTIAEMNSKPIPLPILLKANFLVTCDISELIQVLSEFTQSLL